MRTGGRGGELNVGSSRAGRRRCRGLARGARRRGRRRRARPCDASCQKTVQKMRAINVQANTSTMPRAERRKCAMCASGTARSWRSWRCCQSPLALMAKLVLGLVSRGDQVRTSLAQVWAWCVEEGAWFFGAEIRAVYMLKMTKIDFLVLFRVFLEFFSVVILQLHFGG